MVWSETQIVRKLLAENKLDGYTLSSLAVSGGRLFLRTETFLYSLSSQ